MRKILVLVALIVLGVAVAANREKLTHEFMVWVGYKLPSHQEKLLKHLASVGTASTSICDTLTPDERLAVIEDNRQVFVTDRVLLLASLSDILAYSIGQSSVTKTIAGNWEVFSIGRPANQDVGSLLNRAQRSDVRKVVSADRAAIEAAGRAGTRPKTETDKEKLKMAMGFLATQCELKYTLEGAATTIGQELHRYTLSLDERMMNKSMGRAFDMFGIE